jgi:curved DNA-binding protein CbpA
LNDYYKIFNLSKSASSKEIKSSFKKLAVIHHPDKNGGSKKSEEIFKSILIAYETLIDTQKRAIYDIKFNQFQSQNIAPQKPPPKTPFTTSEKEEYKRPNHQDPTTNSKKEEQNPRKSFWGNNRFVIITLLILLEVIYLFFRAPSKTSSIDSIGTSKTAEKSKTDQELERHKPEEPTTGEIDFKNE